MFKYNDQNYLKIMMVIAWLYHKVTNNLLLKYNDHNQLELSIYNQPKHDKGTAKIMIIRVVL